MFENHRGRAWSSTKPVTYLSALSLVVLHSAIIGSRSAGWLILPPRTTWKTDRLEPALWLTFRAPPPPPPPPSRVLQLPRSPSPSLQAAHAGWCSPGKFPPSAATPKKSLPLPPWRLGATSTKKCRGVVSKAAWSWRRRGGGVLKETQRCLRQRVRRARLSSDEDDPSTKLSGPDPAYTDTKRSSGRSREPWWPSAWSRWRVSCKNRRARRGFPFMDKVVADAPLPPVPARDVPGQADRRRLHPHHPACCPD
jgi:hypothetical protein